MSHDIDLPPITVTGIAERAFGSCVKLTDGCCTVAACTLGGWIAWCWLSNEQTHTIKYKRGDNWMSRIHKMNCMSKGWNYNLNQHQVLFFNKGERILSHHFIHNIPISQAVFSFQFAPSFQQSTKLLYWTQTSMVTTKLEHQWCSDSYQTNVGEASHVIKIFIKWPIKHSMTLDSNLLKPEVQVN